MRGPARSYQFSENRQKIPWQWKLQGCFASFRSQMAGACEPRTCRVLNAGRAPAVGRQRRNCVDFRRRTHQPHEKRWLELYARLTARSPGDSLVISSQSLPCISEVAKLSSRYAPSTPLVEENRLSPGDQASKMGAHLDAARHLAGPQHDRHGPALLRWGWFSHTQSQSSQRVHFTGIVWTRCINKTRGVAGGS